MIAETLVVSEKKRASTCLRQDHIEVAIPIDIRIRGTAPNNWREQICPRFRSIRRREATAPRRPAVPKELRSLTVLLALLNFADLLFEMSVGHHLIFGGRGDQELTGRFVGRVIDHGQPLARQGGPVPTEERAVAEFTFGDVQAGGGHTVIGDVELAPFAGSVEQTNVAWVYRGAPTILALSVDGNGRAIGTTNVLGHTFETTGLLGASGGEGGVLEARAFPAWATLPGPRSQAT